MKNLQTILENGTLSLMDDNCEYKIKNFKFQFVFTPNADKPFIHALYVPTDNMETAIMDMARIIQDRINQNK